MKQEIISEMRKEMQKMKEEIIRGRWSKIIHIARAIVV
jgi:hypothetical protein